ncbi:MAG: hypothetical protein Q4D61_09000 [Cardiobacteriaceae bacterium]|nr:hypothetical protein [Cardiobacteriaceae bacterium]
MMSRTIPLLLCALLAACSSEPSFLGDKIADSPSFYGSKAALILESANPDVLVLTSAQPSETAESFVPPPVAVHARPAPPTANAAGNSIHSRAQAYLQALYRGDGEAAWRYAFVPVNPKQSWWDANTAKGALLMKAGSSEYFAAEKQGVRHIDIGGAAVQEAAAGSSVPLVAHITYGNGSRSTLHLRMVHTGGEWMVAQD